MNPSEVSRTALATSLTRALHSRADPAPLLDDSWGDRLIPEFVRDAFRQGALDRMDPDVRAKALASPELLLDRVLRANAAYADVIVRARYAEDALEAAVARGIGQYVIIGAGFDSFACRRPAYAASLHVFEVDHPATQAFKRQRLLACNAGESEFLHFIAADLSSEGLQAALARSPFDPTRPTFFSWLGVTMYLTREANMATPRHLVERAGRQRARLHVRRPGRLRRRLCERRVVPQSEECGLIGRRAFLVRLRPRRDRGAASRRRSPTPGGSEWRADGGPIRSSGCQRIALGCSSPHCARSRTGMTKLSLNAQRVAAIFEEVAKGNGVPFWEACH